jgi:hypothetical protein
MYYKTSLYTYNDFLNENNTAKIDKDIKIVSDAGVNKNLKNINRIDEIFNTDYNNIKYDIEKYKSPIYHDEENITYFFDSKNGNEYRLDLVVLKENDDDLKDKRLHNKKFISVSFSIGNATELNYDDITNKNELYDVMSRLKYLIKLNEDLILNDYVFMFGKPDDGKLKMYEYFIKICFPDYKLIIDYTSGFPNTNIGFYLIKYNEAIDTVTST